MCTNFEPIWLSKKGPIKNPLQKLLLDCNVTLSWFLWYSLQFLPSSGLMLMAQVFPLQFLLYFHTVLMLQIVESTVHEAASSKSAKSSEYISKATLMRFPIIMTKGQKKI
jgi:hypothetical protein